jgi:peptidyl-prolyl cis-trans isomerase A (cyclophilin A)
MLPAMQRSVFIAAALALALASCKNEPKPAAEPSPPPPPPPPPAEPAKPATPPPPAEPAKPAEAVEPAKPAEPARPGESASVPAALLEPAKLAEKAPAKFKAKFVTSKGEFVVEVQRDWAPNGADRFYNLVKSGFYNDTRFFRAIKGFMVQFGIHGEPKVNAVWREARISDDPVKESNKRGYLTFATAGPNTRTTQLFINFGDNTQLDGMGFSPFGKVAKGMDVVDKLYTGYGEGAPGGRGPHQGRLQAEGNAYLKRDFPELDYIKQVTITK